jgi:hypothetical protein
VFRYTYGASDQRGLIFRLPVYFEKEQIMGKGNNSTKNDKKAMKPKQDKKKGPKPAPKQK